MEFLTLESTDYESALKQARREYGNTVRVHTRKDFSKGSALSRKQACRITFYLVAEPPIEPMAEDEAVPEQESYDAFAYLQSLLLANDLSPSLADEFALASGSEKAEVEILLVRRLFEDLVFSGEVNQKFLVLMGLAGVGKTTSLVKAALHMRSRQGRKVAVLSFDVHRIGAVQQVRELCKNFSLPLFEADSVQTAQHLMSSLAEFDHVFVDTSGSSNKDEFLREDLRSLLTILPSEQTSRILTVSASAKVGDLLSQYEEFGSHALDAVIVTKLDETTTIGNILTFLDKSRLALLYMADGQEIPEDFAQAEASVLLPRLKLFSLDASHFFPSH